MLKFTGRGDYTKIDLRFYGDGDARDVSINLAKPPFNLAFKGVYPKDVITTDVFGGPPASVALNGDDLHVIFDAAPPAADFSNVQAGIIAFSILFVYGTGVS